MQGYTSVILVVVLTVSLRGVVEGGGVDLGLCSNSIAACKCGSGSDAIHIQIPIRQCTFFYRWEPYCRACQAYDLSALCSQFRNCLTCVSHRTGGCSACPVGRYGTNCQGVCQCQNNGVCNPHTGACRCSSGYSGTRCEHRDLATCSRAVAIHNGQVVGVTSGSVSEGSVVTYTCNQGYILLGPATKRCESSGQWSGGIPRCEYNCPIPPRSSNLQANVENYRTFATADNPNGVALVRRVSFTCTSGYSLQGLSELNCLPSSQWNGEVPVCVRSCGQPLNLHNGRYEGASWTEGGRVRYYCNDRFTMTGDSSMMCTNGQWTGNIPSCAETASCLAPTVQNGHLLPNRNTYTAGTQIIIQCASSYVLDGVATVTCENTGQWNVPIPRCNAEVTVPSVSCPALAAPDNGNIQIPGAQGEVFLPGERVDFTCNEGHVISGSSERICQADGTWSGRNARCIRVITCQDPGIPANAIMEIRQPRFGGSRRGGAARIHGFIRTNSRTSGRDGSEGSVVDIDIPVGQFRVFTRISYDCESRFYRLVGSQHRTCQNSGEWSGRQPTCIPICGKSEGARAPVIINGQVSRLGEWPWQVAIAHRRQGSPANVFYGVCGGTMLSENWIVTAAHCVTNRASTGIMPLANIKIYLGKFYRDFDLDDEFVQEFEVTEIHVHPQYDPEVLDSDMAVVRLSQPATLTDRVSPVCLPSSNSAGVDLADGLVQSGSIITVTGWGETENRTDAARLMMARLGTISNTECEDKYAQSGLPLIVTSNMFCAGHDDGRSDTCYGDSGGPAVAFTGTGDNRQWYLVGVVSWGSPVACGMAMQYSGFTKVSRFLSFINQFTGL